MSFSVQLSGKALKTLKSIDRYQAKIILSWIEKNLEGCSDPRVLGKSLSGNLKDYWRYRVGSYRLIADIQDTFVRIMIINIGHRRDIYD